MEINNYTGGSTHEGTTMVDFTPPDLERSDFSAGVPNPGSLHGRIGQGLRDNMEPTRMARCVVTTGAGSPHQLEGIDGAMEVDSDTQSARGDNMRVLRQHNSNSIHQQNLEGPSLRT